MPRSKAAVNVPIALPRRSGPTRLIATREREGKSSEKAAPIPIAPAITTARSSAAPSRMRPAASISAAPTAQRAGADPVGQPARQQPGRDDGRGEDAEDGRAVADPALVEAEDDEGGDGREAERR